MNSVGQKVFGYIPDQFRRPENVAIVNDEAREKIVASEFRRVGSDRNFGRPRHVQRLP